MSFTFGNNWQEYLKRKCTEERVNKAQEKLLKSLRIESLAGLTFLDIGLGSGIHSLAAWRAGAERIVSFDLDKDCVKLGRMLHAQVGSPENWVILEGSALDSNFISSLGKFYLVYSWGVLHHTGDTAAAVKNAAAALAEGGVFFVGLYSYYAYFLGALWRKEKYGGGVFPEEWLLIKRRYHAADSFLLKKWLELQYLYRYCLIPPRYSLRSWSALFKRIIQYKEKRGMSFWIDVKDWLGGWPMDFVKDYEFNEKNRDELNLELIFMNTGEGITEFIYKKADSKCCLNTRLPPVYKFGLAGRFRHLRDNTVFVDLNEYLQRNSLPQFVCQQHLIRMYRAGKELYAFTGGLDGVLVSTLECYNIIDGILYYNRGERRTLDDAELYLLFFADSADVRVGTV